MTANALGGHPLAGVELARFVYLDESGISNPEQEPWLVVGGVIVHGDHQLDSLYDALEGILEKVPEEQRQGLVLHTADIYGGNVRSSTKGRTRTGSGLSEPRFCPRWPHCPRG